MDQKVQNTEIQNQNQEEYLVSQNININGTSLITNILTTAQKIREAFGKPFEGDGHKVSGQYYFQDTQDKNNIYTLYDWKATTLFWSHEDGGQNPEEFWDSNEEWVFNIGGFQNKDHNKFFNWLEKKVDGKIDRPQK